MSFGTKDRGIPPQVKAMINYFSDDRSIKDDWRNRYLVNAHDGALSILLCLLPKLTSMDHEAYDAGHFVEHVSLPTLGLPHFF